MSASLSQLEPELQPFAQQLVTEAGRAGLMPRVTSTRRSYQEQVRLYRRAQSGLSPYPAARPGTSAHEYGWAFDMVVSPMSALADVGAYWEELGGVWGGHPTRAGSGYDPVHFEYPGWRDLISGIPDQRQQQDDQETYLSAAGEILVRSLPLSFLYTDIVHKPTAKERSILDFFPGGAGVLSSVYDAYEALFGK